MGKQGFIILFYLLLFMLEVFCNKKLKNKAEKELYHGTNIQPRNPQAYLGALAVELAALRAEWTW